MKQRLEYKIAKTINSCGGNAYYVGGYVRDKLLNIDNTDIDIEVHNIEPKLLKKILSKYGKVNTFGSSFGIYNVKGIDIAMPRKELNTGVGHKDFEIYVDPYIGTMKASKRRDFTINSLMQDVLTNEIIDHHNGLSDLNNKIIRHIDPITFVEDPLRVLRAAQFSSRFEFKIHSSTLKLCKSINIQSLSKQRVEEELKKALLKANKPSIFFKYLKKMNQLNYWFKQLDDQKLNSTLSMLDKASEYRQSVNNKYGFMLSVLCINMKNSKRFLKRFTDNAEIINYVTNMNKLVNKLLKCVDTKQSNFVFSDAIDPQDLIYYALTLDPNSKYLFENYKVYQKVSKKHYVTGKDLIELGFKPNDNFKKILDYSYKLQLSNITKSECINKTIKYARTIQPR